MEYNAFDTILEGYQAGTEQEVRDYASGMVWCDIETSRQNIAYARYFDTVNGIDIYYDYGADYYFFCPADEQEGE